VRLSEKAIGEKGLRVLLISLSDDTCSAGGSDSTSCVRGRKMEKEQKKICEGKGSSARGLMERSNARGIWGLSDALVVDRTLSSTAKRGWSSREKG